MSFAVYRSSAGSGKTFTLVKEYLKILMLKPEDYRHILAITFTNKAANEMKDRVLQSLREIAKGSGSNNRMITGTLIPILEKETGFPAQAIVLNAERALELILHNYSDFAIGTIDSFSNRLIRTFAHDFGLPVNFNVELDSKELLNTAVDLMLDKVGDDPALTSLLVKFLETRLDDEKGWFIESILTNFANVLLDEEGQQQIKRLKTVSLDQFNKIAEALYVRIKGFENQIIQIAKQGFSVLKARNLTVGDFFYGDKGIWKYFENLAAGRLDKLDPNSYVLKTVTEDKWYSGKITASAREEIDQIKADLLVTYEKLQKECELHREDYLLRRLISKTIYPLAVLNEIEKVMTGFKQQNNLIHISEFNTRIAGIVLNEPVPFIYERLGEKYHHILIDEFQDTSALQWMNFVPLIENALGSGYFNLIVGDGKQAIYRWRGGDVEQFNKLPSLNGSDQNEVLKQREKSLTRSFEPLNLNRNFRSKPVIVELNNRFFRLLADRLLADNKKSIFDGLEQQPDNQKNGGYLSVEFIDSENDGITYEDKTLLKLLRLIEEGLEDHFALQDIAVLCRSNKNASLIARFLVENGINVISAEFLLLTNSPKVRFLIDLLKYLFASENDIVKASIRQVLKMNAGDISICTDEERIHFLKLPVYDLVELLIRRYRLNTEADPYLQFFLGAVLKFTTTVATGATDFLNWWEKHREKLSIVVPEGLNAVTVTTIHQAKGLEFPLVIIPFAHEALKNTRPYIWVDLPADIAQGLETAILRSDKDMESTVFRNLYRDEQQKSMIDLLNLLYVAMTRAGERLHILTRPPSENQTEIRSLPGFFKLFLQMEGVWNEDQYYYEFGDKEQLIDRSRKPDVATVVQEQLISNEWREKIKIRMHSLRSWNPDDQERRSQWGNRIHTMLSWLVKATDKKMVLARAVQSGLVNVNERIRVETIIDAVIQDPQLVKLFSDEVITKTEPEILLPTGNFYRPDRVIFDGDQVTVLDYKSGKPKDFHREQLINYAGYIREMGYRNVRNLLVYLEPEVTVLEV